MTHLRKHFPACFSAQHQTSISTHFMNMPAIVLRPPDCSVNQSNWSTWHFIHKGRLQSAECIWKINTHSSCTACDQLSWVKMNCCASGFGDKLVHRNQAVGCAINPKDSNNIAVYQKQTGNITRGSHPSGSVTWDSNSKSTQLKGSNTQNNAAVLCSRETYYQTFKRNYSDRLPWNDWQKQTTGVYCRVIFTRMLPSHYKDYNSQLHNFPSWIIVHSKLMLVHHSAFISQMFNPTKMRN